VNVTTAKEILEILLMQSRGGIPEEAIIQQDDKVEILEF
jgi:hypothetical protein